MMDELNMAGSRLSGDRGRREIELHETHLEDQLAALKYLQSLPYLDKNRIAVMGFSFGGIQTMLAVERRPGYRVAVDGRRGTLTGTLGLTNFAVPTPTIQFRKKVIVRKLS